MSANVSFSRSKSRFCDDMIESFQISFNAIRLIIAACHCFVIDDYNTCMLFVADQYCIWNEILPICANYEWTFNLELAIQYELCYNVLFICVKSKRCHILQCSVASVKIAMHSASSSKFLGLNVCPSAAALKKLNWLSSYLHTCLSPRVYRSPKIFGSQRLIACPLSRSRDHPLISTHRVQHICAFISRVTNSEASINLHIN